MWNKALVIIITGDVVWNACEKLPWKLPSNELFRSHESRCEWGAESPGRSSQGRTVGGIVGRYFFCTMAVQSRCRWPPLLLFQSVRLLSPKCENEHHQKNVLSPLSANVQQCRPAELPLLCNIGASSPEEELATRWNIFHQKEEVHLLSFQALKSIKW